jgi:mannose-1-phosphate guanylyltransferase/phosphomannomutase
MKAVILAGGAGTRMRPLTYVMPKCLLPVGGKPLLERTMGYLSSFGIRDFVICVAYLQRQVMDSIGDGSRLGVRVEYATAGAPMGTAGQLKTAESMLPERFLAMNGDILTDFNVGNLLKEHEARGPAATIALKRFEVKVPYGHVAVAKGGAITEFKEKPTFSFDANAGIYVMEPRVLSYIPAGRVASLERETFPAMLAAGEPVGSYYEDAKWADVGSLTDFERVNDEVLAGQIEGA